MNEQQTKDLIEAIVDCFPGCTFAKKLKSPYTEKQQEALLRIWDKIPNRHKLEAGYDEGEWE
jgi:hypothetical protein